MLPRKTRLGYCGFVVCSILLWTCCCSRVCAQSAKIKVAVVQYRPILRDVSSNRKSIVSSTTEAAKAGAKIIVQTEMATSGYSFFSREEISKVAEEIPGATTKLVGQVARQYRVYVVVGLPERDSRTGRFYNSAVLIGPDGRVLATYRKRSHLLESSWASIGEGKVPVVRTPLGRIAIAICADLYYPEIARSAAVDGADLLVVPTNGGFDADLVQVRAFENDLAIALADRYGQEEKGASRSPFSQETFTIPLPFAYDFNYGPESAIVTGDGNIAAHSSGAKDAIVFAEISLGHRQLPLKRHPEAYSILGQDTLEDYTFKNLGLPKQASVVVGAGKLDSTVSAFANAVESEVKRLKAQKSGLQLAVLPARSSSTQRLGELAGEIVKVAQAEQVDIVVGVTEQVGDKRYATSVFAGSDGKTGFYREIHDRIEGEATGEDFFVIDRSYGRLALLGGDDLLAPESTRVLAKLGVDLVAVSADSDVSKVSAICRVRTTDGLELIVANKSGQDGIYQNDFGLQAQQFQESAGDVVTTINTINARSKKELRRFDGWDDLLRRGP
jgi:predicted amidohydrolase